MQDKTIQEQNFMEDLDGALSLESYPELLRTLLRDRTTGRNILWVTDDYQDLGPRHQARAEMTLEAISGKYFGLIAPRVEKSQGTQTGRTKNKAEVFTAAWLCNEQNNLVDEAWFGRADVFNIQTQQGWTATTDPIAFPEEPGRSWEDYIDENRLEVACGEAPYLVSRYDTTTGDPIEISDRIGLLDRKLRVVNEKAETEEDWLAWAERAFQATYGFELQGDNLFLARKNLLATYADYLLARWGRQPTERELQRIATIISWNLWQMDGLTGFPPYSEVQDLADQLNMFDVLKVSERPGPMPCTIKDWRKQEVVTFLSLKDGGGWSND